MVRELATWMFLIEFGLKFYFKNDNILVWKKLRTTPKSFFWVFLLFLNIINENIWFNCPRITCQLFHDIKINCNWFVVSRHFNRIVDTNFYLLKVINEHKMNKIYSSLKFKSHLPLAMVRRRDFKVEGWLWFTKLNSLKEINVIF